MCEHVFIIYFQRKLHMHSTPVAENSRLTAVNRFLNLQISSEKELQDIVSLAATICESPVALITFIDKDIQHFKFKTGTELSENLRRYAFCDHLIRQSDVMVVNDLSLDERFADNPLVTSELNVRFYAGAPLTTHEGENIGSICVVDHQPRNLNEHQKRMLGILSRQVINILEFEISLKILKEQYAEAESSATKLRSFFESSSTSHVLISKNFEVITFNKAFYDFIYTVYGVKVVTGIRAIDHVDRNYITDFVENFKRAVTGETVVVEREIYYPATGKLWWQFVYSPAYDNEGNVMGISWNCTNIHERKQYEQKILEQNEALRRIAYVQSHDFRKPVASILGLLNLMKLEGYGHHEEYIKLIEQAANELDNTIKDIVYSTEPILATDANYSITSALSIAV